jgi:hypothetical protein
VVFGTILLAFFAHTPWQLRQWCSSVIERTVIYLGILAAQIATVAL